MARTFKGTVGRIYRNAQRPSILYEYLRNNSSWGHKFRIIQHPKEERVGEEIVLSSNSAINCMCAYEEPAAFTNKVASAFLLQTPAY